MKGTSEFAPQSHRTTPPPGAAGGSFVPGFNLNYESLLARLRRNWYWFVLAVALCVGLAWLKLRYEVPVYQSYTSLLIEDQTAGTAGLSKEVIAEELGFENSYEIDNEIYMLRSQYLMERVVEELGLDLSVVHIGQVRNTDIYRPRAFSVLPVVDTTAAVDAMTAEQDDIHYGTVQVRFDDNTHFTLARGEGDTTTVAYGTPFAIGNREFTLILDQEEVVRDHESFYYLRTLDPSSVAATLAGRLTVAPASRTGSVVNLQYTDPVPKRALDVLNTLVSSYEAHIVEQQGRTGAQTLEFIQERLDYVTDELYAVESDVAAFKQQSGLTLDVASQGSNYLERINAADAQLAELQVRRELIEEIRDILVTSEPNDFDPLPLTSEVISGVLTELIGEYNNIIFERGQRLETTTPNHPLMATYTEQLANLKQSILRSINTALRETSERVVRIEERIRPLEASINRLPANEQRLLQIMRQREIKNNLFMFLLQKREDAALTIAAQVPNTRIIDRARVTSYPISPNRTMTYLLAIGLGLIVPGSLVFMREILGKSISTEQEVMQALPYPVVGRLITTNEQGIVVNGNNRSGLAEGFRLLRTNLGFLLPSEQSAIIQVTSSISGEGKTFVAANLAAAMALTNKRVVVVGTDMRKPRLGEMVLSESEVHRDSNSGLSSYLIGKSSYEEIIHPSAQQGLDVVPSGPLPPNPAELLIEGRMATLLHRLRQDYDVVILDAPPVGIVTDALSMKDFVNVTLFVTRINLTPKKSAPYIEELVESGKLPRFNLVINGLSPKAMYGYGYGYYE